MKRPPTEEQKQKAAERRERMRAIAKQIAAMDEGERFALAMRCPVVNIEGHSLSTFNQCMIGHQIPAATIVGGFRQWLKAGRAVRKGEHGAAIWVPISKGGEEMDPAKPTGVRFVLGTVFDVSQTDEVCSDDMDGDGRAVQLLPQLSA